jgi:hypothetical protein
MIDYGRCIMPKNTTRKAKKMDINSVNLESYLTAIAQTKINRAEQSNEQTETSENNSDSYISGISSAATAIPTGTYSASGTEVNTFLPVTATNTDSDVSASQNATSAEGSGGAGGSSSSDSEDETETEIITINGVTYLQTTTTDANGITTVTKTQIGTE